MENKDSVKTKHCFMPGVGDVSIGLTVKKPTKETAQTKGANESFRLEIKSLMKDARRIATEHIEMIHNSRPVVIIKNDGVWKEIMFEVKCSLSKSKINHSTISSKEIPITNKVSCHATKSMISVGSNNSFDEPNYSELKSVTPKWKKLLEKSEDSFIMSPKSALNHLPPLSKLKSISSAASVVSYNGLFRNKRTKSQLSNGSLQSQGFKLVSPSRYSNSSVTSLNYGNYKSGTLYDDKSIKLVLPKSDISGLRANKTHSTNLSTKLIEYLKLNQKNNCAANKSMQFDFYQTPHYQSSVDTSSLADLAIEDTSLLVRLCEMPLLGELVRYDPNPIGIMMMFDTDSHTLLLPQLYIQNNYIGMMITAEYLREIGLNVTKEQLKSQTLNQVLKMTRQKNLTIKAILFDDRFQIPKDFPFETQVGDHLIHLECNRTSKQSSNASLSSMQSEDQPDDPWNMNDFDEINSKYDTAKYPGISISRPFYEELPNIQNSLPNISRQQLPPYFASSQMNNLKMPQLVQSTAMLNTYSQYPLTSDCVVFEDLIEVFGIFE